MGAGQWWCESEKGSERCVGGCGRGCRDVDGEPRSNVAELPIDEEGSETEYQAQVPQTPMPLVAPPQEIRGPSVYELEIEWIKREGQTVTML
ncbi:unnamed protein product [Durusdinium trenchii]|uniref:Uncharacterized protein n=1 Tax=Durusdinium trenchii TaxID=1381693 RepID=A0ABP0MQM5_9DINO